MPPEAPKAPEPAKEAKAEEAVKKDAKVEAADAMPKLKTDKADIEAPVPFAPIEVEENPSALQYAMATVGTIIAVGIAFFVIYKFL